VPIAGKDGKTGQTMMKTVIAPALRDRALHVDGWFSTNILGNSEGLALDDPQSLASKIGTKTKVLDQIMGYPVEDHIVMIHYYRPRGDDKEAWDNIDFTGFLGQRMQLKLNFLCKDSVLAAPLVIEIARVLDLAHQRGDGGVQEQLGLFFKAPQTGDGRDPVHALHEQQLILDTWRRCATMPERRACRSASSPNPECWSKPSRTMPPWRRTTPIFSWRSTPAIAS